MRSVRLASVQSPFSEHGLTLEDDAAHKQVRVEAKQAAERARCSLLRGGDQRHIWSYTLSPIMTIF
jgi:hypothetical protein